MDITMLKLVCSSNARRHWSTLIVFLTLYSNTTHILTPMPLFDNFRGTIFVDDEKHAFHHVRWLFVVAITTYLGMPTRPSAGGVGGLEGPIGDHGKCPVQQKGGKAWARIWKIANYTCTRYPCCRIGTIAVALTTSRPNASGTLDRVFSITKQTPLHPCSI